MVCIVKTAPGQPDAPTGLMTVHTAPHSVQLQWKVHTVCLVYVCVLQNTLYIVLLHKLTDLERRQ